MIARYSRPEMTLIWSDRHRYQLWLRVELAVCEGLAESGQIPQKDWAILKKSAQSLLKRGGVDPKSVERHEAITRHDVIAFTTAVAEELGPISRYIHFGLTSSDVVDTALCLAIQEAGDLIKKDIENFLLILKKRALEFRDLPTIGRSHGIFAEPTSFGLKFLGWYAEWSRNLKRLEHALEGLRVGKLSGAVGVSPHWKPEFEEKTLRGLGLRREEVSTQVVPRDRHAEIMSAFAICGSSLERIAIELRHLQRSEVGEVLENFAKGQKGSSAMPHKRNPISAENMTGIARMLRSYAQPAYEDIALWHERDISHSSVERVILPDSTILLDYALNRMSKLIDKLVVRKDRVRANLEKAGVAILSGHFLLELVRKGATREEAYAWIQNAAIACQDGKGEFFKLLSDQPGVLSRIDRKRMKELGSWKHQMRHVPDLYKKVLGKKT